MMLRKLFLSLNSKGCGILNPSLRSCYAVNQSHQPSEEISTDHQGSDRLNRASSLITKLLQTDAGQQEIVEDTPSAERLILKCAHRAQVAPQKRVSKILEFCNNEGDKTYQGSIGDSVALWCSGVLAVSGVFIYGKYLKNQTDEFSRRTWKDTQALQHFIKDYFWSLPKDHLILHINGSQSRDAITADCKPVDSLEEATSNFQNTINECTDKLMNKLGIQLMASNHDQMAVELFRRTAEHGYAHGLFNLALSYEKGRGVPCSYQKAFEYYQLAAEKGDPKAQFNLAAFYAEGVTGHIDMDKALELLDKSAQNGILKAQRHLAFHYVKKKDRSKAVHYFKMAVEQDDAEAKYYLGNCYENGWGIRKDLVKAGQLYQEAAEDGNVSAQFNTAVFYEKGLGGFRESRAEAIKWFGKAAEAGDQEAKSKLDELQEANKSNKGYKLHPILGEIFRLHLLTANQQHSIHKSHSTPNLHGFNQRNTEGHANTSDGNNLLNLSIENSISNTNSDMQSSCRFETISNSSESDFNLACM